MKRIPAALLIALIALFCRTSAEASTIVFSNLGPGNSYNGSGAYVISGSTTIFGDLDQGSQFVPSQTVTLDSIEAALTYDRGPNAMELWLMSDDAGVPGSILESFSFTNLPPFDSTSTALAVGTSASHPLLMAGTQYWVIASTDGDTRGDFNLNSTGDTGDVVRMDGGSWILFNAQAAAFRVSGTEAAPVPEPVSIVLLGSGLVVSTARALKRRWS
jgi:hypothetical protein